MKDFKSFMILICFASLILPSQCRILMGSSGCSLMSYGGRLIIDESMGADKQLLFGSKKRIFIFQPSPGMNRRWGLSRGQFSGSGRGVVWRSNGYCEGPPSHCPVTGRRPCLDKSLPCNIDPPSYLQERPLVFSDVTPTSITVTWPAWDEEADLGYGPVGGYKILMKEQEQTEFDEVAVGVSLSHHFENLKEDTKYDFRVVIVRSHLTGEGPPSTIQTQKTTVKEPPSYSRARTEPLQFSDVTPTSITASWPAWDGTTDLGSGPIVGYRIQIRKLGSFLEEVPVGLDLSHRFDNLTEDTEYEFRVVIVRNHTQGVGPPSRIQMQRTAVLEITTVQPFYNDSGVQIRINGSTNGNFSNESTPGRRPVNKFRHFLEKEDTKLRLGCSLSYGGRLTFGGNVSPLGNQLLFGPGGRKRIFIFQQPPGIHGKGWGHTKYFTGLRGRGLIWTSNGQCRGSQSGQSLCPTTEQRPCLDSKKPCDAMVPSYSNEAPLKFSEVSPTSILVKWPAWNANDDQGSGPIETYIIQYRKKGVGNFQGIRKGLSLSHRFEELEPGTQYEFRLIIVRDHPHGEGPPSEIQPQSTPSHGAKLDEDWTPILTGGGQTIVGINQGKVDLTPAAGISGYNPVRNLTVHPNGIGQLNLTWNPPDLDPTLFVALGYVVTYVLQRHDACLQHVDLSRQISVNDTEVVLTGLEDYAIYNISVIPRTKSVRQYVNMIVEGLPVHIAQRTLPSGPDANLRPVKGSPPSPSSTKLMFSWNRVTCDHHNGPNFIYNCVLYMLVDGEPPERITEVNVTHESHVFTDLIPCGRYRLEVTPRNQMYSGETETVETETSSAPFGVVGDLSFAPDPENGHFNVEWRPPRHTFCPVASYTVTTRLQKQQACHECVDEEENSITDIQETSCVLNNLLSYATYIVSIKTQGNDVGMTGSTFENVLITPKRAPSKSPNIMVDGESTTQTSLTFTWDPVSCQDLNGVFIQYTYSFHQTDSDVIIEEGSIREQSVRRITYNDLAACTNYTFNIRVDNDAFNGIYNTIYAKTNLSIPGNDTNLILKPGTNDTCADGTTCLIATWQKPRSSRCVADYQTISLHQIDVDNCRDTPAELISSSDFGSNQLEHIFTELKPNSLYRATLSVGNSAGSVTTTRELRTSESVPSGAPQDVVVKRPIRGTKLNITWDEPDCGHRNGNIVKYRYKLSLHDLVIHTDTTTEKWHFFENLQRGTTYSFTVSAYTQSGPGPYALSEGEEPFYFRTRD
ncbi:Tyrosine-protein phosphatase Lar [Holothuria leucospilota]|uniref:Tyrosine-protein phosphatase Lar n=1 Tax=Holothuria leucospilota TaxID=206669 RepID=A0A9Q1BN63_HOLLE|nr:Tyrosine-protein phosphatase Lar [Holothuria leucospilota]